MKKILSIILALVILAGAGAYWYYYSRPNEITVPVDDQKTAVIPDLKISLKYPAVWGDASVISSTRVETGQAKYLTFSIAKAGIPVFSFPSRDFTAGREGTTAEVLVARKQIDIKTCSDLSHFVSLISDSISCQEFNTDSGQPFFLFKDTKFGSVSAEGLYFTGLAEWPVLGIEGSENDLDLIGQILNSIESL